MWMDVRTVLLPFQFICHFTLHFKSNYFSILHMQHPVAELCQFFVVGNDQKSLIEFIPQVKK